MVTSSDLLAELRRRGVADASDSTLDRALHSTDASLYRVVPQAVARPRDTDEVRAILDVARVTGVPVTMRGAGTSIAGNAIGPGLVVDTRRHLGRVGPVDPEARTVVVEPGAVHAAVQAAAAPYGLRLGPDPSTHTRCTVGGMIGNNACGSRALGWGRTSDVIEGLDVAWATDEVEPRLAALADQHLGTIRTGFGRFSRQVSGYALEHLLPEHGRRVDRLLAGSEGTLGVVLGATLSLAVDEPRRLEVLGFPSMAEAADAVPDLLASGLRLIACEGLDSRMVDVVRRAGRPVPELPRGDGWLFVEVAGEGVVPSVGELGRRVIEGPEESAVLWRIREAGAGLAARSLSRPAHSGWEDAAVPPARLGEWLRDFESLLTEHGLETVPYGHFGDGCVHARIDFTFDDSGRQRFRDFLIACAGRLAHYGGSLSGEHGDGRARSELLPLMYDAEQLALFAAVKQVCDPERLLNPGVLVDPAPLDADLRLARPRAVVALGSLTELDRCTGVGACVAPRAHGVMCPSFQATGAEKDSTRGRARVLQEALDGTLVRGLDDPAVHEALDLCLSCKGCVSDCPTGVDMAAHKAEVLDQHYAGRRRPLSHLTLGRLPEWLARTPTWARRLAGPFEPVAKRAAGVDPRRSLPALAPRPWSGSDTGTGTPDVWLWGDTFTTHFGPGVAEAAVRVLAASGLTAARIPATACCGITYETTGQLDRMRRSTAHAVQVLAPYVETGVPVVGLEPSCLATLRGHVEVLTFAELAGRLSLDLPSLEGLEVVAQPHCHHASVLDWAPDEQLLRDLGATVTRVPGCCGLAGSWGLEKGHYETSVAIAETHLLPAVRAAQESGRAAVLLADGLSCRHQLADLADVRAQHLVELLASRIQE